MSSKPTTLLHRLPSSRANHLLVYFPSYFEVTSPFLDFELKWPLVVNSKVVKQPTTLKLMARVLHLGLN